MVLKGRRHSRPCITEILSIYSSSITKYILQYQVYHFVYQVDLVKNHKNCDPNYNDDYLQWGDPQDDNKYLQTGLPKGLAMPDHIWREA